MRNIFSIIIMLQILTVTVARAEDQKIWDVAEKKFISEKVLLKNLARSENILLGIRPDNPEHHRYAAKIVGNLAKMGQPPVVLLSFVERSKHNAFDIFIQRHKGSEQKYDATGLDMLLSWPRSGQADWSIMRPVFDMAMLKKLPLKAINFSRYEIGELHQKGMGGLPDDVKSDLMPLLKIKTQIEQELREAYCDALPPEILAKFTMIRRARNGLFALAMIETGARTAVLIAAQKHINKNTGVPRYLDKLVGSGRNVSLSFVETGQKIRDGQGDYIWYTEKKSRPRPCQYHFSN